MAMQLSLGDLAYSPLYLRISCHTASWAGCPPDSELNQHQFTDRFPRLGEHCSLQMHATQFEGVMRGRLGKVGWWWPAAAAAAAAGLLSHRARLAPSSHVPSWKDISKETQRTAPPAVGRAAAMARVGRSSAETNRI